MKRSRGTTSVGRSFDLTTRAAVWRKGTPVPGYHASEYRKDACGAMMRWSDYGELTTYGWEIDHIQPVAAGGSDHIDNLQPLQWANNRHKADNWPRWYCAVSAA